VPGSKATLPDSLPWSVRLFASAPFPPAVCALLACAAIAAGYALYCLLARIPAGERIEEFQVLQVLMIAFTPAASVHALRGAQRDLTDLAPVLEPRDGAASGLARVLLIGRPALTAAGFAGIAVALVFVSLPGSWASGMPSFSDPILWWASLRSVALGWVIARAVAIELAVGFGFQQLGERDARADWLDQRPLAPFARKGLRSVLLLLLFSFLFSLFLLEPWGKTVAIPMLVFFPLLCVAALLLPVSGVQRRLSASKQAELERVDAALRGEAAANLASSGAPASGARLANLVAYRGLVESANTLPFDLAVWLRFTVYVILGLGSWLGGAVVERLLGFALD
jgi:hypothetical protein